MPLLQRMSNLMSANMNDWLDWCENPEKLLRQAVRDLEQGVQAARASAVEAIAHEKLLARQLRNVQTETDHWQRRAQTQLDKGNEHEARLALQERFRCQDLLEALTRNLEQAETTGTQLRRHVQALQYQLAETRQQLASLAARARLVKLNPHITPSCIHWRVDSQTAINRWLEQLQLAEARSEAWKEFTEDLDGSFEDLTLHTRVERELAAMRQGGEHGTE